MVAHQQGEIMGYEQALRVIGRHLDAEPAYHVSILEVEDGFTVRYQTTLHRLESRTVHFSSEKIQDLYVFQTFGRGAPPRRDRHEGMWANFPDGHQEFLRSLGFLLDCEGARSLAVDELEDEVRVTYVKPSPDNPYRSEKRELCFREADIRRMVGQARDRRNSPEGQ